MTARLHEEAREGGGNLEVVARLLVAEADVSFLTGVNCPCTYDETGLS
jgi:hypothetical protein